MNHRNCLIVLVLFLCAQGCAERALVIDSRPQKARLTVNGVDCGLTPKKVPFTFYGTFRIELEKQGYNRLEIAEKVSPPLHERIPLDLITEIVPKKIKDVRHFSYELQEKVLPTPQEVIERAEKAFAANKKPEPRPPLPPLPKERQRKDTRRK